MSVGNFVSYSNAYDLVQKIGEKIGVAYKFRGSVTFANLPAVLTTSMTGYVYNVTDNFTTDSRFIEGAGIKVKAGTNVVVADVGTWSYNAVTPTGEENPSEEGWYEYDAEQETYVVTSDTEVDGEKTYYTYDYAADMKFDLLGTFEDFANIYNMIAGAFDAATNYVVGDVVVYEGALYKFTSDHDAGAWDSEDVTVTTVAQLIDDARYELPIASASTLGGIKVGAGLTIDPSTGELTADDPDELTSTQMQNLLNLL